MNPAFCQGRIIARKKGIEILGIVFGGPVSPVKFIFKINAYFRNNGLAFLDGCCNFNGRDQVFLCIRPQ